MDFGLTQTFNRTFIPEREHFSENYFQIFIKDNRLKEKTIKNYITYLKHFAKWIRDENIHNPSRNDIRAYMKHLDSYISKKTGKPLEITSKQQYFQVVKTFFKFLECEELYKDITKGIKSYKVDRTEERRRAFTDDEVRTILSSINRTTQKGKRDYAILLLCIIGGTRLIEIQRANIEDLEKIDNEGRLWIQGKGKDTKNQYIKIPSEVQFFIDDYLETRPNKKRSEALFTTTGNKAPNKRFDVTSLSRLLKSIFKRAGFDSRKLTPHSLRHSSNMILYKITDDMEKVREHSRHSNISTTQIYINHFDRSKNDFEQQIFNELFKVKTKTERKDMIEIINRMSEEDIVKVSEYIKKIKEEKE